MRKLFREMFGELSPWGRFWLYLGVATLCAAAAMSFLFGWSVSIVHALFLGCMSVIAAFMPEAAYTQYERGRPIVATVLAMLFVPLILIEFYSHAGYTAGLRGTNIETAKVQNTRYGAAQDAVGDDKANLALWRKQLEDLLTQHAWAATVKADGLRAQLVSADESIRQEERRGGCGPKCLGLMREKASLEARIATAELATDLNKRIEATQRILDGKRTVAATTEFKSSAVDHQNGFLARLVTLARDHNLQPTPLVDEASHQVVNLAMAIAGTGLPALALFIAGLYRREQEAAPKPARPKAPLIDDITATFKAAYDRKCNARGVEPIAIAA